MEIFIEILRFIFQCNFDALCILMIFICLEDKFTNPLNVAHIPFKYILRIQPSSHPAINRLYYFITFVHTVIMIRGCLPIANGSIVKQIPFQYTHSPWATDTHLRCSLLVFSFCILFGFFFSFLAFWEVL